MKNTILSGVILVLSACGSGSSPRANSNASSLLEATPNHIPDYVPYSGCVTKIKNAHPIHPNDGAKFTEVRFAKAIQTDEFREPGFGESLTLEIGAVYFDYGKSNGFYDVMTDFITAKIDLNGARYESNGFGPVFHYIGKFILNGSTEKNKYRTIITFKSSHEEFPGGTVEEGSVIALSPDGNLIGVQITYPERKLTSEHSYNFTGKNSSVCIESMTQL